ncbi:hypothetical protein CTEN210_09120 [Chaetoceros tenuissimus]|uniref:Uncharacterized protein n=1 Tax=Chaetoceros tenuissimus TaxID=426638 RepID=A0AAD3CVI2_9STRA|nr:hypothetical protein CTEN210_09120 [Chaetoceros tenuissimus]
MSNKDIPDKYLERLQGYNNAIIEKGIESYTKKKAKVPLMRSKLAVVGRGRDGKTSTINSLKGSPFQSYCESTKGAETSEVDVREIGIDVTNVEVSRAAFEKAERDPYSTQRSVAMKVMNKSLPRLRQRGNHFSFSSFWKCLMPKFIKELKWNVCCKGKYQQNIVDKGTIISPHAVLGEKNIAMKKAFHKDMNTEENLQQNVACGTNPNPRSEEKDVGKKKADVKFSNPDGKSIRMTIFDNGGQRVFRSIQNLFLSREGIFIIVFDMMKILDEDLREEALEHLNYWLSSIKLDACLETNANEPIDPSIKYPPVILVGTHYDEFLKLKGDPSQGLEVLNKILIGNLPLSDLVPLSNHSGDSVPRDRQQLYNEKQDLCFWPVDNLNPNDQNIQAIKRVLLDAAINDPGFDIAQKVPISFLRAMDKLSAISEEVPILPIDSNDPEESCVMNVMHECGVFEDEVEDERHKFEMCKAILRQYQSIGHIIYFDQEGLEDYCILDPQWLINMIAYIVRDFKLHRFRRDFNAMALNDGESWKALLNKGILDGSLLCKLWLDCEHESFLTKLMLELGIFGQLLGDVEALSKANFTVPIVVTVSSNESRELSMPALKDHLDVKSLGDAMKETLDMSACHFNLVPFYSRLVNRLISEWHSGHNEEKNPPEILSSAANLCLGRDYKFSILINENDSTLEILVSDQKKMNTILKYVLEACSFVNEKAFQH